MAKDVVKILGDWNAWAEPVRQGRLVRPDGEAIWVLIRCRADVALDTDGWRALKVHGRLMSRIDHPSVLRLLHTSKVDGQPAWVYEGLQAVSLARALDVANARKEFLPAKTVVEAVEHTAQGIRAALTQGQNIQGSPGPVIHLGPSPSEILVDAVGSLRVAGFSIEAEGGPNLRPPAGYEPFKPGTPAQRAVYGLGALLVHLLGGERPGAAGDDTRRQAAVIRRAIIRVLSRPGEALPDSMTELIRSVLAFDPDERPTLSELQDKLAVATSEFRSAGLRSWAPDTVPGLLKQAESGYPDPDTARMRRHIESSEEANSAEAFTRKSAKPQTPREVATIVGRPPISPHAPPFSVEPHAEATPLVSLTQRSVNPTSETDIAAGAYAGVANAEAESTDPVPFEIDGPNDTWERTGVDDSSRLGGWPLILGAMIGMVVAAVVGWVAVEHMLAAPQLSATTTVTDPSSAPAKPLAPLVPPFPKVQIEPTEASPEAEKANAGVDQAAKKDPVAPKPPAVEEAARKESPKKSETSDSATEPGDPSAAKATEAASASGQFVVSFRSYDTSIDRMRVICHKGGVGEGADFVQIVEAGRGPCTIHGFRGEEKVSVFATVAGPKDYACFKGGARTCE